MERHMMKLGTNHRLKGSPGRFLGLDLGAETLKLVEVRQENGILQLARREILEHGKKPGQRLCETLLDWNWPEVNGAAVTGRFSTQVILPGIPDRKSTRLNSS